LIIEAGALKHILADDKYIIKRWFLKISRSLQTVICCRVSPRQKAEVVRLMKQDDPEIVTLAIGDGANDVPMILEADVGIGLFGKEGLRAVDSSDYAIAEFKYLWQLLFKHGRYNYIRISMLIQYYYYKNFVYTLMQVFFSFSNNFSM
jgi:P-type E1-E2 ATPase